MGFITTNYIGGGLLTERYGSKWVFGLAVFGSSALGFVLPVMASWGSGALLAVRIVQGALQGGPIGLYTAYFVIQKDGIGNVQFPVKIQLVHPSYIQGPIIPNCLSICVTWMPPWERTRALGFVHAGFNVPEFSPWIIKFKFSFGG